MKTSTAIEQYIDDLENFETLINYCNMFQIPHNETAWIDDEWIEKEDELRTKLAEAMTKARAA